MAIASARISPKDDRISALIDSPLILVLTVALAGILRSFSLRKLVRAFERHARNKRRKFRQLQRLRRSDQESAERPRDYSSKQDTVVINAFNLLSEDDLTSIFSFNAASDLVNLALSCKHFGSRNNVVDSNLPGGNGSFIQHDDPTLIGNFHRAIDQLICFIGGKRCEEDKNVPAPKQEWSLAEDISRCIVERDATKAERACLVRKQGSSWIGRYRDFLLLRNPLKFDETTVDRGHKAPYTYIKYGDDSSQVISLRTMGVAASAHVMRAGRHYALFSVTDIGEDWGSCWIGIIRPMQEPIGGLTCPIDLNNFRYWRERRQPPTLNEGNIHCCMFDWKSGLRSYSDWDRIEEWGEDWHGMESAAEDDTVGLLLDFDEGTLSVYKNGKRLGVMKNGIKGEYCWMAQPYNYAVRIKRGSMPTDLARGVRSYNSPGGSPQATPFSAPS